MYRKRSNERPHSDKHPSLKRAPPNSKTFEINALPNKCLPPPKKKITISVW